MSMKEYMTLKTMIQQQAAEIEAMKKHVAALVAQIDAMNEHATKRRPGKTDAV